MRFTSKTGFLIATLIALFALRLEIGAKDVLWRDFDMKNIPEPREREASIYDNFFREQMFEGTKRNLDAPRLTRALIGRPKPAADVNAVDEVPDSSWYTNRHHLRPMTMDELVRGPNQSDGPDFDQAVITKAKNAGVTPGMMLKDRKGDSYLVKFDPMDHPELLSGAEVISTKILYAAGYSVPENYIAHIHPDGLQIKDGLKFTDPMTRTERTFTRDDLNAMFERLARSPDGSYRVLASKVLPGKAKGPFPHVGIRHDDPNDLIPHEHRRELRGLRVIASWINHVDMKEEQSLDMYVEENGRKFLRHYLLDFGSTLTGGVPLEYYHGREYALDSQSILKELFSLGFYTSADEKQGTVVSPAVGIFSSADFHPKSWRPTYPIIAFENMTDEDAFWAMRILLSFTEPELHKIVETAEYSNPQDTQYVFRTLLDRREILAEYWLRKVNPIAHFMVRPEADGLALSFRDYANDPTSSYVYQIHAHGYRSEKKTTRDPMISLDRETLGAVREKTAPGEPIQVTIWTQRKGVDAQPVTIFIFEKANDKFAVERITRG